MENLKSVAGIVFSPDRGEVLLIQRRDVPVWVLPGGGIEPGELPEPAIVREILEETGFTVKAVRLVGDYLPVNRLSKRTHLYECEILGGKAQTSKESKQVRFYPLDRLPKFLPPPYLEWIEDARLQSPPLKKFLTGITYPVLFKYLLQHPFLVIRFLLSRIGWAINT